MSEIFIVSAAAAGSLIAFLAASQGGSSRKRIFTTDGLTTQYDFVVVGAGSSGCVLASRLALLVHPDGRPVTVLLVEAGDESHKDTRHSQADLWPRLLSSDADWDYSTTANRHMFGRHIPINRGKVLGGSSSINCSMWVRGCRRDYDRWAEMGNVGWDWDSLLPLFSSLEDYPDGDQRLRGRNGAVRVSDAAAAGCTVFQTILKAVRQLERPRFADGDYNDERRGACWNFTQESCGAGPRGDAFSSFVEPILPRSNLKVVSRATTRRVLFEPGPDGPRAIGVEFEAEGEVWTVRAAKEVVLCGGAIGSPHILLLSGVGPAEHLRSFGIGVVADNANVGENLHDHPATLCGLEMREPIKMVGGAGLATTGFYQSAWSQANTPDDGPDMQVVTTGGNVFGMSAAIIVLPKLISFGPLGSLRGWLYRWLLRHSHGVFARLLADKLDRIVSVAIVNNQPHSRGRLQLKSKSPHVHPSLEFNMCDDPSDMARLVEGVKLLRGLLSTPVMRDSVAAIADPPELLTADDKFLEDFARRGSFLAWHPAGTCRMGVDSSAAVDPRLRVLGVKGLRVADASIMPFVCSGNTNWTCMMIGAKGAALLAEDHSLLSAGST